MRDLKSTSSPLLIENLKKLVADERRICVEILWHLREVERRRLHLERGFPSLFEYCTRELNYSESAAFRRISAMRALRDNPEIEDSLKSGTLSVTAVSQVQTFLRSEKIQNQKTYTAEEKRNLFVSMHGKSTKEVQRNLATLSPAIVLQAQRERVINQTQTEVKFVANETLLEKLKLVRGLCSHRLKDTNSYAELFELMADTMIEKLHPERQKARNSTQDANGRLNTSVAVTAVQKIKAACPADQSSLTAKSTRYIPVAIKRGVWKRARGKCTYQDALTRRRCNSVHKLQFEHKWPFALGGASNDPENLTLLCVAHNLFNAVEVFGEKKMESHLALS